MHPTRSLARRLVLLAVSLLVAALAVTAIVATATAERHSRDLVTRWLADKVGSVAGSVDAFDATSRKMAERAYGAFARQLPGPWQAEGTVLRHAGTPLNGRYDEVDAFASATGGVATVFVRQGEDFVRVTTNVKQQDGKRAVGTQLARTSPAYEAVREGRRYVGRAVLFGTPYMTVYEPVRDAAGQVAGVLFIGFDIADFQRSLEEVVAASRFFGTGGTYVVDPRQSDADAVFVVHPQSAGRKVLEVAPQAAAFLARLRATADVVDDGATALLRPGAQEPWAVKRASQSTGWWVVAEVPQAEAMAAHRDNVRLLWLLLAGCAATLAVALLLLVRREVSRPLAEVTSAVDLLAHGDLRRPFGTTRDDELGALVRQLEAMRRQFVEVIDRLRSASEGVRTAATEIATGHRDLSSRTEHAAGRLQETAGSMQQLVATVRESAGAAGQANELAVQAARQAQQGGAAMEQVEAAMHGMDASARRIGDIIGVIDGIAFQTNILALNAAVEAARAGEQGRGFAVVAGEVRALAQRSTAAAREVKDLIEASNGQVQACSTQMAQAGQTMRGIVGHVQDLAAIIDRVTRASGEQSEGLGQVGANVAALDEATQQNAALVEQGTAAAQSLQSQAQALAEVVGTFRLQ